MKNNYLLYAILLFVVEVAIALFVNDSFVRPVLGDFLVVIMLYCFLKSTTKLGNYSASLAVLLFAYTVETLQYFHFVDWLGVDNKIIRTILGSSFSWTDIIAYTLGIFFILILEILRDKKQRQSPQD